MSPRVVMERLGHSQIGVTMNTHAHITAALDREATSLVRCILAGSAG